MQSWPRAFAEDGSPQQAAQPIDERNSLLSQAAPGGQPAQTDGGAAAGFCGLRRVARPASRFTPEYRGVKQLGAAAVVDNGKARQLVSSFWHVIWTRPFILDVTSVRPALRDTRAEVRRAALGIATKALKCAGDPNSRTT